jgi:formate hydrogenlyase subunit 6/NADH:ubiquinone oxidoreductase subunit I
MAKVIYDSGIEDFLAEVSAQMAVYAPVFINKNYPDQINFKLWKPELSLALKYPVTITSPTEILLPDSEPLFSFEDGQATPAKVEPGVIFGLSLEDLESVHRLTKIMEKPIQDEPYQARRNQTFIIGLDKFSPPSGLDFDLYFQEFETGAYAVTAKTKQGKKWLGGKNFKNHPVKIPQVTKKPDPLLMDPLLPRAIRESATHPIWDELAETCFGCGICSYVCPLCYCFETEDKTKFGDSGCGERCRSWDSCMLQNFAATSNHNFRPELRDRIYNWYSHKFYRLPKEQGFSGCVDCNRCAVYCPAKINFRRVLSRVLTDYKKRPKK